MSADVIQIGDLALKRKERTYPPNPEACPHKKLELDAQGDIVTCLDCKKQVSAFWALIMLVEQYRSARDRLIHEHEVLQQARSENLHLIAARKVDKAWRSRTMVPTCPHCHKGIFAEDGFGGSLVNREMEQRRRQVAAEGKKP
jgi:hypothetical protein